MEVRELIPQLQAIELKKLALKSSETDVLGLINSGIMEIYKRFSLLRESIPITPVTNKLDYKFDGTDSDVGINVDDYQLILIETVTAINTKDEEFRYTPNNSTRPSSFSTPSYNVLRMNKDYEDYSLFVDVRLAPQVLTRTNEDIPLPPQMLELLRLFIAYKAFSVVSAGIKDENNTYFVRFDSAATKILAGGQFILDPMDKSLLYERGFV